jgi:UDP-N-acetylmuramoyl-L-alanyl-D-glutamate--2,6-diaminopimelate ligase
VGIALAAGTKPSEADALHSLEPVTIPGRMQKFKMADGTIAYVDYAHNYISLKSLLDFTRATYPDSYITVVTGTTGGKALDRREGMAKAASEGADSLILTSDDSDFEDPHAIGEEMAADVTNPNLDVAVIDERETAIRTAFHRAHDNAAAHNVVLVIGKGDEEWLKIKGKHVPYASDTTIVEQLSHSSVVE